MNSNKAEETLYDVLKVGRKASISEIVAAYHSVKGAFSKDSVATYSLFSSEETQNELGKLEEAYQVLSNLDKRREYDKTLQQREGNREIPKLSEVELLRSAEASTRSRFDSPTATVSETPQPTEPCTGALLKELRSKRGLSAEDVSRITKIPTKFIVALESEEIRKLPARVYVQGFVKNLAALYRLEPAIAVTQYLQKTFPPKSP